MRKLWDMDVAAPNTCLFRIQRLVEIMRSMRTCCKISLHGRMNGESTADSAAQRIHAICNDDSCEMADTILYETFVEDASEAWTKLLLQRLDPF